MKKAVIVFCVLLSMSLTEASASAQTNGNSEMSAHIDSIVYGAYNACVEASSLYDQERYAEAMVCAEKGAKMILPIGGKKNEIYILSLQIQMLCHEKMLNYTKTIALSKEVVEICANENDERLRNYYASELMRLAQYYRIIENYNKAYEYAEKGIAIVEDLYGEESSKYAQDLHYIATICEEAGDYTLALRYESESLAINERYYGMRHPICATALSMLARYNNNLGNHRKAIALGKKALTIFTELSDSKGVCMSYADLSKFNFCSGNYSEAIKYGEMLMAMVEPATNDYATALSNLSGFYTYSGDFDKGIALSEEALTLCEKISGKGSLDYVNKLCVLAFAYARKGEYTVALDLQKEILAKYVAILGDEHPLYIDELQKLALLYFKSDNVNELERCIERLAPLHDRHVRSTMLDLTENERIKYWGNKELYWYNYRLPNFAYKYPTKDLIEIACNGSILAKGMALNSSIEFSRLLMEEGSADEVEKYENLKNNRLLYEKLLKTPQLELSVNKDSLALEIEQQEIELLALSKSYGDFTSKVASDWKDVRNVLSERDVAVEMLHFPIIGSDSIMYMAFVIRPGYEAPEIVRLFEEKQLDRVDYRSGKIGELVWKPLAPYFEGVENVYFAPEGRLYSIAIESVPDWENEEKYISDRWQLHRLSSIRELTLREENVKVDSAILFGGLDFGMDVVKMESDSRKRGNGVRGSDDSDRSFDGLYGYLCDSLGLRAGVHNLPASLVEVNAIGDALRKQKIQTQIYSDSVGTETSFKSLSGKNINVLHIATHGFYLTRQEAGRMNNADFLMLTSDGDWDVVMDKGLTRSGLLFSGANNALLGKDVPDDIDDGILTAKEIATLDFRKVDLVVLSACQTGLGEPTGDGVFGLQRGFKKAGAKSILMSLWKVDDAATSLLMTQFFENYASGMDKYTSLREAQRYVREYEVETDVSTNRRPISVQARRAVSETPVEKVKMQPYKDPFYWAAFVLLDDVD